MAERISESSMDEDCEVKERKIRGSQASTYREINTINHTTDFDMGRVTYATF